jgi:hypothetical protein
MVQTAVSGDPKHTVGAAADSFQPESLSKKRRRGCDQLLVERIKQ